MPDTLLATRALKPLLSRPMVSKSAALQKLQLTGALSASDLVSIAQHAKLLGEKERVELEATLRVDVESEFDARFLAEYLGTRDWPMTEALRVTLQRWLIDENLHQKLFLQVYEAAFPDTYETLLQDLLGRDHKVVFGPLEHLMGDEFEVLCLLAYDELSTVKAYQALIPQYLQLGPSMGPLLYMVIRDEGRHYAAFARLLRSQHAGRISESAAQIEKIRAAEGTPYANTFVLDHDCDDWTDTILDEAVSQLKRALGQSRNSA